MKRAERMQDRSANLLTSTISTLFSNLLWKSTREHIDHCFGREKHLQCAYNGGDLGSTGAESKWR